MIINESGFDVDSPLRELLGDGTDLVAEAAETSCELVEPVHFLGLLAQRDWSILRTDFLARRGVEPAAFREHLYASALDDDREPGMPIGVGADVMAKASLRVLDTFERRAADHDGDAEALFLLVVFEHLTPQARRLLVAVAGSQDEFARFTAALERRRGGVRRAEPFDPETGALRTDLFDASGRKVLTVLREEVAALGNRKVTALHLLYALAGSEHGVLPNALMYQGMSPLRDVHGALALQLRRPGVKRAEPVVFDRTSLHASVQTILTAAVVDATKDGTEPGEAHIARAAVAGQHGLIPEWLAARGTDLDVLREYLANIDPVEEEDTNDRLTPVAEIGARLRERILGQDHAIARVLPWIKRLRFGFPRERGPAAVLLFLGPSGSGKTELARELARTVYGSDEHLLMLEMGQFATRESGNMFIGAPPGYVGYGEGKLTNGLRDKPRGVVLFDEIEKAHENVWPALLRFLDEGLIEDPAGPTRDGRGCVVVLTSNLGADTLGKLAPVATIGQPGADGTDDPDDAAEAAIRGEVLKYLKRPEIYNRVDDKVVFRAFDSDTYKRLVERQIALEGAQFAERGTRVEVMADVSAWLTERALAARLEGARCVPRLTNRHIVSPVIDVLTLGEGPRPESVIVSLCGDRTLAERA